MQRESFTITGCLGWYEMIGTQGKLESEASSWGKCCLPLRIIYGIRRYGTVECGKSGCQSLGEGCLHACDFCVRYSDCAAPMDEDY